jgi:MPBQ/MSBQ methyltransferase
VPTILLMRLTFGAGLCRFGMFRAVRGDGGGEVSAISTVGSISMGRSGY